MSFLILIIVYLVVVGVGLSAPLLGAAWPSMFAGLGVPESYLGIISVVMTSASVVAGIYGGRLLKRFETGRVVAVSILLTAAAILGFALSGRFIFLCIFAVPLGLGFSMADVAANNYTALHFKAKHMNWLHCFWGVGAATGPLLLSYGIKRYDSWRSGYFIIGGILFLIVLVLLLALPQWKKAAGTNTQEESKRKIPFRELFKLRGITLSLAAFFCYCSIESAVGLWGSSYLVFVKNISAESAAQCISLYFWGITLGRLLSGFLTMKLGNRQMVRLGYAVIAAGIAMTALPLGDSSYLTGFIMMGLGCAPNFPCLIHDTPTYFGKEYSPSVIGLQMACSGVGATVMPPLFGVIAGHAGYTSFPLFLGVILVGMIIAAEMLKRKIQVILTCK